MFGIKKLLVVASLVFPIAVCGMENDPAANTPTPAAAPAKKTESTSKESLASLKQAVQAKKDEERKAKEAARLDALEVRMRKVIREETQGVSTSASTAAGISVENFKGKELVTLKRKTYEDRIFSAHRLGAILGVLGTVAVEALIYVAWHKLVVIGDKGGLVEEKKSSTTLIVEQKTEEKQV